MDFWRKKQQKGKKPEQKDVADRKFGQFTNQTSEFVSPYYRKLHEQETLHEKRMERRMEEVAKSNLKRQLNEVKMELLNCNLIKSLRQEIVSMKLSNTEVQRKQNEIQQRFKNTVDKVWKQMNDFNRSINKFETKLMQYGKEQKQHESAINKLHQLYKKEKEKLQNALVNVDKHLTDRNNEFVDYMDQKTTNIEARFDSKIKEVQQIGARGIDQILNVFRQNFQQVLTQQIKQDEKMDRNLALINNVKHNFQRMFDTLDSQVLNLKDFTNFKLDEVWNVIGVGDSFLKSSIETLKQDIQLSNQQQLRNIENVKQSQLILTQQLKNEFKMKVDRLIQKVENRIEIVQGISERNIEQLKGNFVEFYQEMHGQIRQMQFQTNQHIFQETERIRSENQNKFKAISLTMESNKQIETMLVDQLDNLSQIVYNYADRVDKIKNNLDNDIDVLTENIRECYLLISQFEYVRKQIKIIKNMIDSNRQIRQRMERDIIYIYEQLKEQSQRFQDFMGNQQRQFQDEKTKFKSEIAKIYDYGFNMERQIASDMLQQKYELKRDVQRLRRQGDKFKKQIYNYTNQSLEKYTTDLIDRTNKIRLRLNQKINDQIKEVNKKNSDTNELLKRNTSQLYKNIDRYHAEFLKSQYKRKYDDDPIFRYDVMVGAIKQPRWNNQREVMEFSKRIKLYE